MDLKDFRAHIIAEVCDYAIDNDFEPDDILYMIAYYINAMLKISTFNEWKRSVADGSALQNW